MREIVNLTELKEILTEELLAFARYCDEKGLRYYLCGGTLLGAIRHQGFIPWDDDIDVAMPREDYERFIDLTAGGMTERYAVQSYKTTRDHAYPFVKIYDRKTVLIEDRYRRTSEGGVFIDVFPVDGIPESMDAYRKRLVSIKILRKLNTYAGTSVVHSKTVLRTILRIVLVAIAKTIGTRFFNRRIDRIARECKLEGSRHCGVMVWGYGERERVETASFLPVATATFEGHEFSIPQGYDQYLASLYGDYMTPPPEPMRVTHHDFKVYWKD